METRELYQKKVEAQMHEWSAKLDVMKAQGEKANAKAKLDMQPHLDAVHAKFVSAKAAFHDVAQATDDTWNEVATKADHVWNEFKAATGGAYDALKRNKPD